MTASPNALLRHKVSLSRLLSLLSNHPSFAPSHPSCDYPMVQAVLSAYGFNSTSYLALEQDKQHFIHPQSPAVTAYAVFNQVAIAAGEPICPLEQLPLAIREFCEFAKQRSWQPLWFEVTEPTLPALQERGFRFLKLGEEPFFDLEKFSLKGNKMANVRSSGNTARNRGVQVREFLPHSPEAVQITPQLKAISQQWLVGKGIGELSFTLGSLSLDCPADRRYFIAEQNGEVIAFLTYTPIYAREGVYLDLMRRIKTTPPGTMDLLITESFRLLRESGVKLATLGMAPLANVKQTSIQQSPYLANLLHQIYEHGQQIYNYKHLHDFKQKFHPHRWESKYLAYRHLGLAEWDAIIQAVQGKSIAQLCWHFLNQPVEFPSLGRRPK